jgi:hypothetical protein
LYHTTQDPREWANQIDNPKHVTTVEKLRALVPSFEKTAHTLTSALTAERRETREEKKKE